MLQQRQDESQRKLEGEELADTREPICIIPPSIAADEAESLKQFQVKWDVCFEYSQKRIDWSSH